MDIRKARRFNDTATVPPKTVANPKEPAPIPDVDDNGVINISTDDFDGDVVIQTYMDFLKNNGITEDDIASVQEALLTSENVSWSFDLFEKIPVVFEVRQAWVDDYIIEILDDIASKADRVSQVRYSNTVAECNLAASMRQYKDEKYTIKSREDLDKARTRIQSLPFVIQNALVKKLAVFDRVVAVATSDWAIKNFMKPQQEK